MRKNRPEDYLKTIYQVCERSAQGTATTSVVARRMRVSDGTASSMIRQLADSGHLVYQPYRGAQLTVEGLRLALHVLRRQRLLELFLARTLSVPWERAAPESERLETSASEDLIRQIDQHLGFPDSDARGEAIPQLDGTLPVAPPLVLAGCLPGTVFVVSRVLEQSEETRHYLMEAGVDVGVRGEVTKNSTTGGIIGIAIRSGELTLSRSVAAKIAVSIESAG
jgi:DtxR family Mn-dependent transcriptional regulator